jgi:thiamine-monophosphate kinase
LLADVHFPGDAAPEVIVNRAFAANLSDLAAMGASPHSVTMALTFPEADAAWLEAFATATTEWSRVIPLVGGNLAKGALSITLTVMGVVPTGTAILRSGARTGDDIYVSGTLGGAAGAVKQLGQTDANPALVKKYQQPTPQLALGVALRGIASAAIDISDGLIADLSHLIAASHVGATLDLDAVPMLDELKQVFGGEVALSLALGGGDDYELCFTAATGQQDKIKTIALQLGLPLVRLGTIVGDKRGIRDSHGAELHAEGYRHF